MTMANTADDEDQDPLEKMDEEDDEESEDDAALSDPKKLKKKGLHIEGEDDLVDADGTPILAPDPFAPHIDDTDEDEEIDVDEEFADKEEW
jgi:hypothetical protein